jgi:hypothetical protein
LPDVRELRTVVFMKTTFIESNLFEKHRGEYLANDDYNSFQNELLTQPEKAL